MAVVDAYLEQIARYNPTLNAIVNMNEAESRQRARDADEALQRGEVWGSLHGVPFTVKDAFETAALTTTSHHKPLANYVPQTDATVVARLKAAGGILLGKTNLAELAGDIQTGGAIFGRANNPWQVDYTTGGSSGGSAAAVAAGFSAIDIGSDLAGSIRIPAHFCGVYGLKPSENLVSGAGHIPPLPGKPNSVRHLNTFGPLARSVSDLKLVLPLIAGPDGRHLQVPPLQLADPESRPRQTLRLAWTDSFGGVPVAAEIKKAIEDLAGRLEKAGCQVAYASPPDFDFEEAWQTYGEIFGAESSWNFSPFMRFIAGSFGARLNKEDPIIKGASRGIKRNITDYIAALTRQDQLMRQMDIFLSGWDAWLCPVSTTTTFTHRPLQGEGLPQKLASDHHELPYMFAGIAYTSIFNFTGNPAVALPLTKSASGLPIGVQVVGQRWQDMTLLTIAEQLVALTEGFVSPQKL